MTLPRAPDPRPPTREADAQREDQERRMTRVLDEGIEKRRRQPKAPAPTTVRGLRFV